jgi:uncharacterized membrane protein SirB2
MSFLTLKYLHIGIVILSVGGFLLRGIWMMFCPLLLEQRWVRIAPHVVDTLLFATGITLAFSLQLNPFSTPWFLAKLIAIVVYILAGMLALRRGPTRATRAVALVIALGTVSWAAAAALTHQAVPWI